MDKMNRNKMYWTPAKLNRDKLERSFWKGVAWVLGLTAAVMVVGVFLRALDFSFWLAGQ